VYLLLLKCCDDCGVKVLNLHIQKYIIFRFLKQRDNSNILRSVTHVSFLQDAVNMVVDMVVDMVVNMVVDIMCSNVKVVS